MSIKEIVEEGLAALGLILAIGSWGLFLLLLSFGAPQ